MFVELEVELQEVHVICRILQEEYINVIALVNSNTNLVNSILVLVSHIMPTTTQGHHFIVWIKTVF